VAGDNPQNRDFAKSKAPLTKHGEPQLPVDRRAYFTRRSGSELDGCSSNFEIIKVLLSHEIIKVLLSHEFSGPKYRA
jgi:hypothetical protein